MQKQEPREYNLIRCSAEADDGTNCMQLSVKSEAGRAFHCQQAYCSRNIVVNFFFPHYINNNSIGRSIPLQFQYSLKVSKRFTRMNLPALSTGGGRNKKKLVIHSQYSWTSTAIMQNEF